jgi:hypothetical protein
MKKAKRTKRSGNVDAAKTEINRMKNREVYDIKQ